uniref:p6-like protein n=1 Tax=Lettuce chlorosis virus TaxID=642478 RepID=A0A5C1IY92_9CLOS|nr:p6-like protein [Lettuce chlorosis virus]
MQCLRICVPKAFETYLRRWSSNIDVVMLRRN